MSKRVDRKDLMRGSLNQEKVAVADRFAKADAVMASRPSGLAVASEEAPAIADRPRKAATDNPVTAAIADYQVGKTVEVPLSKLRDTPFNARVFYSTEEVDEMANSLSINKQDVAVSGYVNGDLIIVVDGSKRLRGARAAGLASLRVDICEAPKDNKEIFLKSRRINRERSSQTVLDDAVRFKQLIDQGLFAGQEALAAELSISQTTVSRTLKINLIPERLLRRMKDSASLTGVVTAHAIAQIFEAERFLDKVDEATEFATTIIDEVLKEDLSTREVQALVTARLAGPRTRVRNEARHIQFAGVKGTIKTNEANGEVIFAIKGLESAQVEELRGKIEALCTGEGSYAGAAQR